MTTPSPEGDTPPMASPADSGNASKASPADSDAKSSAQSLTLEQALAMLADEKKQKNSILAENAAFKKAQQQAEEANLSELEKERKARADAEARDAAKRDRITALALEAAAQKLGVSDPEYAAFKIRKDLQVDDEGNPSNADALLQQFLKDNPQFASASARPPVNSGGATNPSRASTAPGTELSREIISKMTAQEYEARRAEIQQWLYRNPPSRFSR